MPTALITGASAGLGTEFARLFAADKHDLVLVARRRDRLDALAAELSKAHGIQCHVVAMDLGAVDAADKLMAELAANKLEIEFLVNNAGFGSNGAFATLDGARELSMIHLNVTTLVALTRALLPGMLARKRGRILNLGSTAGFQPGPFMATYYATKAFVNSFSESLWYELKGTGVTATVSCPGPTATEFADAAAMGSSKLFKMGATSASTVAREAYQAMHKGRSSIIHGLKNKFSIFIQRLSPRSVVRAIAAQLNKTKQTKLLTP